MVTVKQLDQNKKIIFLLLDCLLLKAKSEITKISEDFSKNACSSTCQNGAQDWTRTSILFTVLPPQGSASTNFATWAGRDLLGVIVEVFFNLVIRI